MIPSATQTRYLIRTARGYQRGLRFQRPGANPQWTQFPEEAQIWDDLQQCHEACRQYTRITGESAVVVVHVTPTASSDIAVPK